MYAVLKTGGKQYKVAKNDVITVEKLALDAGASVELDQVLLIGNGDSTTLGTPLIEGARVSAEILEQKRGRKITVFKKKRRKNYRRTIGHRQELTVLRITEILGAGEKKAGKAAAKEATTKTGKATKEAPATKTKTPKKEAGSKTSKTTARETTTKTSKTAPAKTTKTASKKSTSKTPKAATKKKSPKTSKSSDTKE
ncbi:MAG: 50S ribosomal protein L21 [Rhodospirillaceae bacterium]|nr:50S ribosomal protein L21 [Rhodospirillaceae bacterium]|tara:strand:+ start:251 stop:841 length:591 start_codon:yes stop_codon:yes gene_type:complete